MKMDKPKGVQYRRVVSGYSEPCLSQVGHMSKDLLNVSKNNNVKKKFVYTPQLIQLGIQNAAHISMFISFGKRINVQMVKIIFPTS